MAMGITIAAKPPKFVNSSAWREYLVGHSQPSCFPSLEAICARAGLRPMDGVTKIARGEP